MHAIKSLFAATVLATAAAGAFAAPVGTFNVTVGGNITDYTGDAPAVVGYSQGVGTATLDSNGTMTVDVNNMHFYVDLSASIQTIIDDQVSIHSVFPGTYSGGVFSINDPGDIGSGTPAQGIGQETPLSCSGSYCDDILIGSAVNTPHPYDFGSVGSVSLASGGEIDTMQLIAGSYTYERDFKFTPTPAVPVPAAAWLLGSGLLGLAGTARRRSVNALV